MNPTTVLAAALAVLFVSTQAMAQQTLIEEVGAAIEIKIAADGRVLDIPVLKGAIERDAAALASEYSGYAEEDYAERGQEPTWNAHYLDAYYEVTFLNEAFASVISSRDTYSGGAHGNQSFAAVNLDLASGRMFGADEMFGDFSAGSSEAFETIQAYARERLAFERSERLDIPDMPPEDLFWVNDGTETPEHLSVFTIVEGDTPGRASAIRLYFAPYQVGAYVEGSYTVEVPALVFAPYLTPEFAPLFD